MEMIKIDPDWRPQGKVWDDKDRSSIAEIYIFHGNKIFSLQFLYVENRTLVLSEKYGAASSSCSNFDVVRFDYSSEFLTGINVVYYDGPYDYRKSVSGITFCTNKGKYGPFGSVGQLHAHYYSYSNYQFGPCRAFGGFHGTATGSFLESLGLYVRPTTQITNTVNDNVSEVKKENGED